MPEDEEWEFLPNTVVLCLHKNFQNSEGLVAIKKIEIIEQKKYKILINSENIEYIILNQDSSEVGTYLYLYDKDNNCIEDYLQNNIELSIEFIRNELKLL